MKKGDSNANIAYKTRCNKWSPLNDFPVGLLEPQTWNLVLSEWDMRVHHVVMKLGGSLSS